MLHSSALLHAVLSIAFTFGPQWCLHIFQLNIKTIILASELHYGTDDSSHQCEKIRVHDIVTGSQLPLWRHDDKCGVISIGVLRIVIALLISLCSMIHDREGLC